MNPTHEDPRADLPRTRARWYRTRASRWILLAVVVVGLVALFKKQPVQLNVNYHLENAAAGLEAMKLSYHRDGPRGESVDTVRFEYKETPARAVQVHRLRLAPGRYLIDIELVYSNRGGPPVEGSHDISGRRLWKRALSRPLDVERAGNAEVYF